MICTRIKEPFNVVITKYKIDVLIWGQINGTVIFQNCCHSLAPSISAASYKLFGTFIIAPINNSINIPIPAQIAGNNKLGKAHLVLPNDGIAQESKPTALNPEFRIAISGLKINCHRIPTTTTEIIFGKKKTTR